MPEFNFNEKGFDREFCQDVEHERVKINKHMKMALRIVGKEMEESLLGHLRTDWYDAWKPKRYKRRADTDPDKSIMSAENISIEVTRNSLIFDYSPKGNNDEKWKYLNNGIIKNGDELINVIQYNKGWDSPVPSVGSDGRMIGERPFWNNFVKDQEGKVMDNLMGGLLPYEIEVENEENSISLAESYL